MTAYDYGMVNWKAIERLSRWYSGDIQDVMDKYGAYGFLKGISLYGVLKPGQSFAAQPIRCVTLQAHAPASRKISITV